MVRAITLAFDDGAIRVSPLLIPVTPSLTCQELSHGLKAVMQLAKDDNIEGVYGPLIELITVDDKFHTAVEVTAGNRYAKLAMRVYHLEPLFPCMMDGMQGSLNRRSRFHRAGSSQQTEPNLIFRYSPSCTACSTWWLTLTRPLRVSCKL